MQAQVYMTCQFKEISKGRVRCSNCGREIDTPHPPKKVHANCKPRGLGDTIASITRAIGIQPCGKCKQRQQKLNQVFPYD